MGILSWIIVGLIAGWLAGVVMKGSGYGLLGNILVGIIGAVIGGFLAGALFNVDAVNGVNFTTILVSFLGAVILIAILRAFSGSRRTV